MKLFIILSMLLTNFAYADVIKCISEDEAFTISAEINFKERKVVSMEYFKEGTKYLEFSDLDMDFSNNIFTRRRDHYEIQFNASALYMDLFIDSNGEIEGWFLPRNSVLAMERKITCEMI